MYRLFRPLLFSINPETAHALTLYALRTAQYFPITLSLLKTIYKTPIKPVMAFGLTFKNPVGLAAGYDKDAVAVKGLGALGFGHIEVGSVTPMPQGGNPKPRVFRLVEDEAIINRMGFPSQGSGYVLKQLNPVRKMSAFELVLGRRPVKSDVVLGINLGKNKSAQHGGTARLAGTRRTGGTALPTPRAETDGAGKAGQKNPATCQARA
jgi:dihydroorotate dehydrogenase